MVQELAATQGKRFAVIADEAHSSQSGQAAAKLKAVLSPEELKEFDDGGEISSEDVLAAQMAGRAAQTGVTYVAFTATPKAKTLETFGRLPDPCRPKGKDNLPAPFHVYSMRQAIEEEFILDVLQNYTSYKLAFKLANRIGEPQGASRGYETGHRAEPAASALPLTMCDEVESSEAMKGLMRWVRLHPYNISQKVQIVVEHFRENVADLLEGEAKAMVVTGSRAEAVRWQLAVNKYIQSKGYPLRTLVAFSGEVNDRESGSEPFKETSSELNPTLKGRDIREAFNDEPNRLLLVANKFQTGFDQPKLCGMYVDKKLAGIQAVQTLSRLNRCHPGKDRTYVLDFVNEPDDILEAFKTFYTTATLEDVTDPYLVVNLREKLDGYGYYDQPEIDRVVAVELNPHARQKQLEAAITPVADRLLRQFAEAKSDHATATELGNKPAIEAAKDRMDALLLFKSEVATYQRVYTFLSQVFDYGDTEFEKRSIFYRYLLRLLKFGRERTGVDLSEVVLTHHTLRNRGNQPMPLPSDKYPELKPMTEVGTGQVRDPKTAYLSEIIAKLNDLFEGDLSDDDMLVYVNDVLVGKLLESETMKQQASSNTKEQFAASPDLKTELVNAIIDALDAHTSMSRQALESESVQAGLRDILLGPAKLYERLNQGA